MRNISAFIIAVMVYALFLWLYVTQFSQINLPSTISNEHIVKIDIRNIPSPKKALSKKASSKIVKDSAVEKKVEMDVVAEALKSIVTRKSISNPISKTEWVEEKVVPKKIKKKPLVKKRVVKKKVTKKKSQKKPLKKHLKKKKLKKKKIVKKKPILKKKKIVKKKKKPKNKKPKIVKSKIPKKKIIEEPLIEERVVEYVESTPPAIEEMVYMPDALLLGTEDMLSPPSSQTSQAKKVTNHAVEPEENSLASFLSKPSKSSAHVVRNYPSEKVKKLYGSSFHTFTETQKKFIKNNLDDIQQITQRVLTRRGYPEGAGETGQEGTNVVEFYLHPNGDISDLRLKRRIGYRSLDENTITLIRVAYKDYPYPETRTKIIFYVNYSVYGY